MSFQNQINDGTYPQQMIALPPVRSKLLLACSEEMLQAAISMAVQNGLLPKS